MKIYFAWGGCGNLFQHFLLSNSKNYERIRAHYKNLTSDSTWTDQEWNLRNFLSPENLIHDFERGDLRLNDHDSVKLAWQDSNLTAFHYCIKNPGMNHLPGDSVDQVGGVLWHTHRQESIIRTQDHIVVDRMLSDIDYLMHQLHQIDPLIQRDQVGEILTLWKYSTLAFFDRYSSQVLEWFQKIGVDIDTKRLHNLIYENTNIR